MNLDNIKGIKKLDSKNMLGSLQLLSHQVEEVLEASLATPLKSPLGNGGGLRIPASYKKIDRILVLGMGGSVIGSHVFKTLFSDELKVTVDMVSDYHIPAFVNNKTLVLASSYSGNTEEPVNAVKEALKKKAKIMVITSGGKLKAFAKRNKLPLLNYTTKSNTCDSPRMGLGYSIVGQLVMFAKVGVIKLTNKQIKDIVKTLVKYEALFGVGQKTKDNPAKLIAKDLLSKKVLYTGAEHLSGSVHICANQMNENAKRFAVYFLIPELNHHLLEGMIYPASNKNDLAFLLISSNLYGKKVQKRFDITVDVLDKNKIKNFTYVCGEKTRLEQVFEVLVLGSYVSYYSAILQNTDPTAIPFVDYFKEQLSK